MITGLSGTSTNQRSNAILNPLSLFRNGEQGVWYDPSDIKLGWRKNLLTYSEQFSNAVWTPSQLTITSTTSTTADGLSTYSTHVPTTASGLKYVQNSTFINYGDTTYTVSIYAKNSGYNWLAIEVLGYQGAYVGSAKYNLTTGVASFDGRVAGTKNIACSTQNIGSGWYRCILTCSMDSMTSPTSTPRIQYLIDSNGTFASYTGDGTSGVLIGGVQVERLASVSQYQKITDGIQDYYAYHPLPVLYQDSAGTTPVTGIEQPVGLMLDKSKGLALGASIVTAGSSWTVTGGTGLSISGLTVTGTGGMGTIRLPGVLTSGVRYRVTQRITSYTSGSITGIYDGNSAKFVSGLGSFQYITIGSTNDLYVYTDGFVGVLQIDLVQAISGNHASQHTSASRPTLSARYNLATYSEIVGQSSNPWAAYNFTIENNSLALPSGAIGPKSLAKLTATSTPAATVYQITCPATQLTVTFYAHLGTRSVLNFLIRNGTSGASIYGGQLDTNGVSGAGFSGVNLGGGIYRVIVDVTSGFSAGDIFQVYYGATGAVTAGLYWYIGGMDIRVKGHGGVPIYQRVNTATDYDTTGFPLYLKCDGVDDWMVTNSIDFSGTNKMTVSSGLRKLSDAASMLTELSANYNFNTGSFYLLTGTSSGYTYSSISRGSATINAGQAAGVTTGTAPDTTVITTTHDIAGDLSTMRRNGVAGTSGTADKGVGNYGNYPLYLFRRGGSSIQFNGHMYGLIIRGAATPTATIQKIEKYMNKKVGKIY